jgi:hypothetical protein
MSRKLMPLAFGGNGTTKGLVCFVARSSVCLINGQRVLYAVLETIWAVHLHFFDAGSSVEELWRSISSHLVQSEKPVDVEELRD